MYLCIHRLTNMYSLIFVIAALFYNSGYWLEKQIQLCFGEWQTIVKKNPSVRKCIIYVAQNDRGANTLCKCRLWTENIVFFSTILSHKSTHYHTGEHSFRTISNSLMLWSFPCLMCWIGEQFLFSSLPLQSGGHNIQEGGWR